MATRGTRRIGASLLLGAPDCTLRGFNINGQIRGSDPAVDPLAENHTHATIGQCLLCNNFGDCGAVIEFCDGLIENNKLQYEESRYLLFV